VEKQKISLLIITIFLAVFLRFYKLGKVPSSLYWEEAALGYDAYSILKTGKDFHGNIFPIVAFESFGDFKPSSYFYAAAVSEFFLGLNQFAVRLPSALAGIGIVALSMLIAKEIFGSQKHKNSLIVLSGLVTALSPWALQFSRTAFEANLAAFFSCLGIWLLLMAIKKRPFYFLLAALSFAFSIYTYHSARIFAPLLLISYALLFLKIVKKQWKWVLASALLGTVLILPIIFRIKDPQISHRFQETSAFTKVAPIVEINKKREADGNTILSRILHHRYWYYGETFLKNTLSHFDPNFLFIKGDENMRHSTGQVGIFYLPDALFLLVGVLFLGTTLSKKKGLFLIIWWLLALVPAGLTKAVPHALRTLLAVPAPQIILSYGVWKFIRRTCPPRLTPSGVGRRVRHIRLIKIFIPAAVFAIYAFFASRHLYDYFGDYQRRASWDWQYGYKEMVQFVSKNQKNYEKIYITRSLGRPSMYFFFYNKIDPAKVQQEEKKAPKDQEEMLRFENIIFGLPDKVLKGQKSLLVLGPGEKLEGQILQEIKDKNGNLVFNMVVNK